MEVHNVFESADGQLAVIGVYVEFDLGSTVTVAARRRRDVLSQAIDGANLVIMPTSTLPETNAISSNMLETVFQSIEAIATPGTKVTTTPLVFSEYVNALKSGSYQAYELPTIWSSIIHTDRLNRYSGSLTTPPCSEGVNWLVATQKLKISPASLQRVANVVKFNARITQNSLGQPNILTVAMGAVANLLPVASVAATPA